MGGAHKPSFRFAVRPCAYIGRSTEGNGRRIRAYGNAPLDRDAIRAVFGGPA